MRPLNYCSCYGLLLVTGLFCRYEPAAAHQLPPKCCADSQVLTIEENTRTVGCEIGNNSKSFLLPPPLHLDPLSDGFLRVQSHFPQCDNEETLVAIGAIQAEGNRISCLDKVMEGDRQSYVGLLCVNKNDEEIEEGAMNQETILKTFDVPDVFTMHKCCPLERSYSGYVSGCWDENVPDDWTLLKGLVEAVLNNSFGYIDVEIGAPNCESYEVLYDYFVPYKFVFQLDSDAVKLRIPGREGYVILPPESVCLDFHAEDHLELVVRACQDRTVLCEEQGKTCIRKCCGDGETMLDHNICGKSKNKFDPEFYSLENTFGEPIRVFEVNPGIWFGDCEKYILQPEDELYPDDIHYLTTDGNLYFSSDGSFIENYCIDILTSRERGNVSSIAGFVCLDDESSDYSQKLPMRSILYFVYGCGMIISCFFLLLTLLVYVCLPSLRNVHGKTIMCYISSLLVAYLCLIISQIGSVLNILSDKFECKLAGYATIFAFLAAFSWLNVLCFDIWYTFGTVRSSFIKRRSNNARFVLYNVYCWGYSSVVLAAAVGSDLAAYRGLITHVYVPDVGVSNCWFSPHTKGIVIFFLVPIGFQLMSNIFLFIITIRHCYKVKSEIAKMQYNSTVKMRYHHDKRKLVMTVKLFIVMGIGWSLEILSQCIRPLDDLWFPSDAFNILQGILIFVIFTIKKRIIRGIRNKVSEILPSGCIKKAEKTRPPTLSSSVFTTSSSEYKISANLN